MSPTPQRLVCSGLLALVLCATLFGACYETPPLDGYYTCSQDSECADGGLVCDDGVCCSERGEPLCLSRVLDGGMCADGGTATRYFRDEDGDGYGNLTEPLLRCAVPTTLQVATNDDDCNDNPAANGVLFYPAAPEQCDGRDNDCDGDIDEGLDGGLWFQDDDQDGFGDPANARIFCQPPPGWTASMNDCAPANASIHPAASEVCNAVDDNCNGVTDDIAEAGQPCTVSGALGLCAQGRRICRSGADACEQTVFPVSDKCDGLDNNCDGTADDKPECGGPTTLINEPGVARGAKYLLTSLNGGPGSCVKDNAAAAPADSVSGSVWRGAGAGSHVFWAEQRDGGSWDLSRPGANLKLFGTFRSDGGVNSSGSRWSDHNQPVVLLCGPGGFLRLVHQGRLLQGAAPVLLQEIVRMPTADGGVGSWVVGGNSSPDILRVLRQVQRVEILIQPESVTPTPSFQADYTVDFGFP
ncbi:putative metal-binding motif-containing protein [Hyalangium rubrum]|uniref:Metal-binding motif-containing protein n=1 Tax=Hyalangium rubrum TaxID=3103134 RepID=A0ABU5GY74_9BACT|nr:putative metal-binding motif-containing protein [Hyalangium sp. s54d21]MDY7226145.1 putative metal-binding motif-containing protein [Hyalangium sp. s54d21]